MTYELVLELKNAGFKQTGKHSPLTYSRGEGEPYHPYLDELIEACGEEFYALWVRGDNTWFACKDMGDIGAEGSTPEEAVAKLWLAINKK